MLDLPYNLFSAKRKHIKECIKEVEKETKKVSALVDTACDILQEIIKDDQFNSRKADAFNTKIRQAKLIIETCKKFLSDAKESIDELMPVMSLVSLMKHLSLERPETHSFCSRMCSIGLCLVVLVPKQGICIPRWSGRPKARASASDL